MRDRAVLRSLLTQRCLQTEQKPGRMDEQSAKCFTGNRDVDQSASAHRTIWHNGAIY